MEMTLLGKMNAMLTPLIVLEGGSGLDLYRFKEGDGADTVLDTDQRALLQRNDELLTLAYQRAPGQWAGRQGTESFTAVRGEDGSSLILTFNGSEDSITLKNFDFAAAKTGAGCDGLRLIQNLAAAPDPNKSYLGDTEDWDTDGDSSNGIQRVYDARGNAVRADGEDDRPRIDQSNRADTFYGSNDPEVERFTTGEGDDTVYGDGGASQSTTTGGIDLIDAGAGRDIVEAGAGDDRIEGGTGGDLLWGNAGDDLIYAASSFDGAITIEDAIANGEQSAAALNTPDFLSGDAGDDTLIGSAAADALLGGSGCDILIGGAGDDNLLGDGNAGDTLLVCENSNYGRLLSAAIECISNDNNWRQAA